MIARRIQKIVSLAAVAASLSIAACSMDTESNFIAAREKVQLREENAAIRIPTASAGESTLAAIAEDYRRTGRGAIEITVTYDPKSRSNTAMKAASESARIADYLRRKAGAEIAMDLLPVRNAGEQSETLITFPAYTAHAPDCTPMAGTDGTRTHINPDYKYGCTIESQLSKQIANPRDLAGRGDLAPGDGRRQANVVDVYRSGEPNAALQGYSASE